MVNPLALYKVLGLCVFPLRASLMLAYYSRYFAAKVGKVRILTLSYKSALIIRNS